MDAHLYALFGHPVGHSRSPCIYAAFARRSGRQFDFELIDCGADGFADAVRAFAHRGGRGANMTVPHKLAAAALATSLSARARLAGAVNAFRCETDDVIFGDNTDGAGLVADLTRNLGIDPSGKRVLVLGAGGAARGILGPLLDMEPAELVVANRDADKARLLAARFAAHGRVQGAALDRPGEAFELVVNATSASLDDSVPAAPPSILAPGATAYDLMYRDDGRTAFTRWAEAHGAGAAYDGWGMLVEQAAETWKVWFGERPGTAEVLARAIPSR